MLNDKIVGMFCVTVMFLAVVGAWIFTSKPLDPAIKELGGMIITGIMGTMIGFNLKKKTQPPPIKGNIDR